MDLSAKGLGEAKAAGGLLKTEGIKVDMAFTSYLKRVLAAHCMSFEPALENLRHPKTAKSCLLKRSTVGHMI